MERPQKEPWESQRDAQVETNRRLIQGERAEIPSGLVLERR